MSITTAIEAQTVLLASELPLLRPAVDAGTAFPINPSSGARFWRTDLGMWGFYDGTRWLGPVVERSMSLFGFLMPTNTAGTILAASMYGAKYLLGASLSWLVNSANDGANHWHLTLYNDATASTIISTDVAAPSAWQHAAITLNATHTFAMHQIFSATKVGSPGLLYASASTRYRDIL